jgi:hypothetical protein
MHQNYQQRLQSLFIFKQIVLNNFFRSHDYVIMDFCQEVKKYPFCETVEEITTFYKAVETLIEHPNNHVQYIVNRNFEINNIGVLETSVGGPLFDLTLNYYCEPDVLFNVRCTEPIMATCGDKPLNISKWQYILKMCGAVFGYKLANFRRS